jgi:preprotein translocase subunit SecG
MTMSTIETILLVLLVADALALAALVLLQQGKGADVGAAFGSGSANTVFGSAGSASFLTKLTAWLSIGFFLIAFGLAYTAKERAATESTLGIPQVSAPAPGSTGAENSAEELLTPEPEGVDSDIPDV